ncbi:MAG: hypothetical protein MJ193_03185, partial [Clostridia bacterium]|nr:hypothetical protein [Clostridia bacterium]
MAEKKTKTEQKAVRTMPNNIEAEAYVLGAIMIDDKAANDVVPELKEDDFYLQAHRYIFRAMKELQSASKPIEFVSVVDQLELDGKIDEVGSASYISELTEKTISAANVSFYADIVQRDALTRRVIHASNDAVQFAYEASSGKEALEHAEELVYNISQDVSDKALQPAKKALGEALAKIQAIQAGNEDTTSIKTGFKEFDKVTKGLKPGQFVIIAARPSIGKTALALNFATNMALNGKSVAIFNMEMEATDLVRRQLAYLSQVPFFKMENRGAMSDEDDGALISAYNRLVATKLFIDDYSMNRPSDILSKC